MTALQQLVKDGKISQAEADLIINDMKKSEPKPEETPKASNSDDKLAELLASLTDKEPKHNMLLMAEMSKKFEADNKKHEAEIKAIKEELGAKLETALNILGEQKLKSEAAEKAMNEKLEAEKLAKIKTALETAKKEGKLPPENKELEDKWAKSLMTDYETNIALLESMAPTIKKDNNSGNIGGAVNNTLIDPLARGLDPMILKAIQDQPEYSQI